MKKYSKIKYLGDTENKGIFQVKDDQIVAEIKYDGSNARFWLKDSEIKFGSRNVHDLDRDNQQFKDFIDYILDNVNPNDLDADLIYVGEFMVKHSLEYDWDNIPTFIGFDVLHKDTGQPLDYKIAIDKFEQLGLEFAHIIFEGTVKEWEDEDKDPSSIESIYRDGQPEGVVIKNYNRSNQYGRPLFAKLVNDEFQEKKKAKFGQSKINKSNTPLLIEKYCTAARIKKIINKMTVEEGKDLSRSLMNGLYHRVINDMLQEHIIDIAHDKNIDNIDFNFLYKRVPKKCLKVLDEVIQNNVRC